MKISTLFILLFLGGGSLLMAQSPIFITGKITDKKTGEPIAYAHVGIPEKGIGTTTGYDGRFNFKVPSYYEQSTLTVSFIGYKTFRFPIQKIKKELEIQLERASNDLTEIIVMDPSQVENIVRRAVKNIPKNYPTHSTKSLGFYRESRTDEQLNHTYMAEGVLNIQKKSYRSKKEGYVSLVQGRRINLKNPLDTIIRSGFTSGHMAAHRFDVVQNREDFLEERFFPAYKYWIESMTTYNGKAVYIIGFDKDPEGKPLIRKKKKFAIFNNDDVRYTARLQGRIFIEKASYAIIKAEFKIRKKGLRKVNDYPLYAGNWDANAYVVNYRKVGNKWYFSDAVREGVYGGGGMYTNEIMITEINPEEAEAIPYLERIGRGSAFARMTGSYNSDFWQNYNTTPFSSQLAASIQQLENAQKAKEVFNNNYMLSLQEQRDSIRAAEILKAKETAAAKLATGEISAVDYEEIITERRPVTRSKRNQRGYDLFNFTFGAGTHLTTTRQENLSIHLLSDDTNPVPITSLTDAIGTRNLELISHWNLDFYFRKNFFVRAGSGWDYGNSIYKERNIGIGTRVNLSRQRPFYFKAAVQYSNLKYARKLGHADSDYGKFKLNGEKFKGDSFALYYGSRTHNLKISGALSIELDPGREFYIRGSYFMPFGQQAEVWVKERKQIFRKKERIAVEDRRIAAFSDDVPFVDEGLPAVSFSISVGLLFK